MKIQVLVATMKEENIRNLIQKMKIKTEAIIVNQCNSKMENVYIYNGQKITEIKSDEKGLSKSRNCAINNANSDICIIADNDIEYLNDYENIIEKAYEDNVNADVICFKVMKQNNIPYKNYYSKIRKINLLTSLKVSSVEITFKLQSIKENNIFFDEKFGAGTNLFCGEENIFLAECLKKKLQIIYIPIYISKLNDNNSTWFKGYDKQYFITKGACFYKINKFIAIILILQFSIRKFDLYKKDITFAESIKYMIQGYRMMKKGE